MQYARSTQMPDEIKGYMRLAQDKVKVNVIGTDSVGEFNANERSTKPTAKHLSAYIVVHEQDIAKLVQNTHKLQKLVEDPEVLAVIRKRKAEGKPLVEE